MENKYYKINIQNVFWMYSYIVSDFKHINWEQCLSHDDYNEIIISEIVKTWNKLIKTGLLTKQNTKQINSTKIKGKINWTQSMLKLPLQMVNQEVYEECYNLNWNRKLICQLDKISNLKSRLNNFYIYKKIIKNYNNYDKLENINNQRKTKLYDYLFFLIMLKGRIGEEMNNKITFEHYEFELFVYKFYQKEFWNKIKISKQTKHKFLSTSIYAPYLIPDIIMTQEHKPKLIIDTKYYKQILSNHQKIISSHIYQMCSYLENVEFEGSFFDKGIILYAIDESQIELENKQEIQMKQNKKMVIIESINLNQCKEKIANKLKNIVEY